MLTDSERPAKTAGAYLRHELSKDEAAYLYLSEKYYQLDQRVKRLEAKYYKDDEA